MTSLETNTTSPASGSSHPPVETLVILYVLVLAVGLLGNAFVATAIWSQRVVRNILLLNLCASDFLVCGLSVPVSIIAALYKGWTLGLVTCKITFFLQGVPVAASTWSLMMLSLDRYASIQHPRMLSRLRQRRHLSLFMIGIVWTMSLAVCSPILYCRTLLEGPSCGELWEDRDLWVSFVLGHVTLVYLLPGLTVAACHHSVGHKLYAASLAAAAANGDIPLPMPIIPLGRPKEVIIVASVQNEVPSKVIHFRHDKDDGDEAKTRSETAEGRKLQAGRQVGRRARLPHLPRQPAPPRPLTKQASRQSLHSRRRLANMLVALVVVFATCWLPYVSLRVYSVDLSSDPELIHSLLPFCLLLGHTHSAINPIVYWLMNRQTLQTASCMTWLRKGSQGDKISSHFRFLGGAPQDLQTVNGDHRFPTRFCGDLRTPKHRLALSERHVSHAGVLIFNKLPVPIPKKTQRWITADRLPPTRRHWELSTPATPSPNPDPNSTSQESHRSSTPSSGTTLPSSSSPSPPAVLPGSQPSTPTPWKLSDS